MNEYLSRDKTEKKESIIDEIKKYKRKIDKTIDHSHNMNNDIKLQQYMESLINDALHFLMQLASDFPPKI